MDVFSHILGENLYLLAKMSALYRRLGKEEYAEYYDSKYLMYLERIPFQADLIKQGEEIIRKEIDAEFTDLQIVKKLKNDLPSIEKI